MTLTEIEIAGRRAAFELSTDEAARAWALARRLEKTAARLDAVGGRVEDPAAFYARLALALAAEMDEATARVDEIVRELAARR